jgi:hypothetical protein
LIAEDKGDILMVATDAPTPTEMDAATPSEISEPQPAPDGNVLRPEE